MRNIIKALDERVLLSDAPLARSLDMSSLDVERDLYGNTATLAVLNITRPNLVFKAHQKHLLAGADIVRTNSLDISPLSLKGSELEQEAFILNYKAAEIASEAVDSVAGNGRRRFVLGIIRDTGWTAGPAEVVEAISLQAEALLAGGVDGLLLDCLPGIGRIQPIVTGARKALSAHGYHGAALFLQQNREEAGTNYSSHVLSQVDGVVRYRPGFAKDAKDVEGWIDHEKVNLIGGGASVSDIVQLDGILRGLAEDRLRPLQSWTKEIAPVDRFEPVSSWNYYDEDKELALA
ncbi:homocysteine S-methyltransferase family protein [Curvivirga sp.]|uniref:homocysteine S-methyltransferase family protein n=1 Tax=Curvivirga sp. TaxID=2856848 RepID=UPI003B5C7446